jgi:hypothetical protein
MMTKPHVDVLHEAPSSSFTSTIDIYCWQQTSHLLLLILWLIHFSWAKLRTLIFVIGFVECQLGYVNVFDRLGDVDSSPFPRDIVVGKHLTTVLFN